MKANYNKSVIMRRAWKLFKAQEIRTMEMFGDCLRQSWNIAKNGCAVNDITKIYAEHSDRVYGFILTRVGNKRELAQDLMQDVFIKLSKHIDSYDVYQAKLNTWLFTIAKNTIIDHFRTCKDDKIVRVSESSNKNKDGDENQDTMFLENNSVNNDHADDHVLNTEKRETIVKAFRNLKPAYRKIATMYFIRQLSYDEISVAMNLPLGSVKGMINRARTILKTELENVYAK